MRFVFVFFSAFVSHGMTSFLYEIDCLAVNAAVNLIDSVTADFRGFKVSESAYHDSGIIESLRSHNTAKAAVWGKLSCHFF